MGHAPSWCIEDKGTDLRIFPSSQSYQSHQSYRPSIVPSLCGRLVGAVFLSISSHFLSLLFNACFIHSCESRGERKVRLCNVCRIDPVKFFKKLPTPYIPYRVSNILGYLNYTGDRNIIGQDRKSDRHPGCDREGGLQSKVRKIFKIGKIFKIHQIGPPVLDGRSNFLFTHSIFPF